MDPITPSEPLQTPTTPAEPPVTPPAEPTSTESTLLSEPAQAPPAEPATPPDTLITEQVSLVNPDGSFIDGWQNKLPDEIKSEECLKLVKDFPEMARQFVNQRKAIGKDKIALPTEKSTPEEWSSFYEAVGRPKTHTGYTSPEIPEELKDIYSDVAMEETKQFAHGIGATQKQFEEYIKFDIAKTQAVLANQDEADAKARREAKINAEKTLREELGAAYAERMHLANKVITEGLPKETERIEFIEKYGNDVSVIRLLSYVGSRTSEHEALIGELTQKAPTEIQTRIKQIENNAAWRNINSDMSQDERQQLTDELTQLYKQLHPAKKTG
jgi:hypothetical protein